MEWKKKKIIDEFTKKINNFKIKDDEQHDSVFKHWKIISNNIEILPLPEKITLNISKNYIDTLAFNNLNNTDCKLIFYLIFNLNRLLDYNTQIALQSELCHLIIKMIKYSFEQYYRPYSNTEVCKFDFILINELPYIDENLKISDGFYQELLHNKEITNENDKNKDDNIDTKEAFQSMDIDDYEINDDIDESMEALDNDNNE